VTLSPSALVVVGVCYLGAIAVVWALLWAYGDAL